VIVSIKRLLFSVSFEEAVLEVVDQLEGLEEGLRSRLAEHLFRQVRANLGRADWSRSEGLEERVRALGARGSSIMTCFLPSIHN
jgi:hypothetical protein